MTEQYPPINVNTRPRGARYIARTPADSGPFPLTFDDDIVIADSALGAMTLALPTASEFEGFEITVHAPSATALAYVMIQPQPGESVVGPGAAILSAPNQAIKLAAQFNRDDDGNIIRTGWYCTDECAGRVDCPDIVDADPDTFQVDTGQQPLVLNGSFDVANDVFLYGTILVDGAFPFIDITATEVDLVLDTDLVEVGVYWIGILRGTTNCTTFVQITIQAEEVGPPGPPPGPPDPE